MERKSLFGIVLGAFLSIGKSASTWSMQRLIMGSGQRSIVASNLIAIENKHLIEEVLPWRNNLTFNRGTF